MTLVTHFWKSLDLPLMISCCSQVQEMEKDPVYRYLESKMTCARVREYNSNPPPQFYIIPIKKKRRDNEVCHTQTLQPSQGSCTAANSDRTCVSLDDCVCILTEDQ